MIRSQLLPSLILTAFAVTLVPRASGAKEWSEVAHFDKPAKVEKAAQHSAGEPDREITCTIYPDLVVRQRDTDSSDPDDATLIPIRAGVPFDCKRDAGPEAIKLEISGMNFLGRRGPFLLFEEADTNGVLPFRVFDAGTGRKLFEDAAGYDGIDAFAVDNGGLRMGFRRAVRVACSIPKHGGACWSHIVREEKVPEPVASLPAPTKLCADAYRAGKAPKESESIITFDVRLAWSGTGPLDVKATGPLGCEPTP
jgi:hypothetical protein